MNTLISFKKQWHLWASLLILACLPFLSWNAALAFDKMQWFGLLLLPFMLRANRNSPINVRYLVLAFIFGAFYGLLGQHYWGFAAALSLLFFVLEWNLGKLNNIALYALIFYLPITRSFFTLFGFYIRMEITRWAAALLSLFDSSVVFDSTQVSIGGQLFSVDAGCMGLRMVITGFLLTLLIVHQVARRKSVLVPSKLVSGLLATSFLLVVVSNFVRIVLLIAFRSPEETFSHEFIGIATFILVHVLPMLSISRWLIGRLKHDKSRDKSASEEMNRSSITLLIGLALALLIPSINFLKGEGKMNLRPQAEMAELPGYTRTQFMDGIVRYESPKNTITLKPMHPLSFSNHHPLICWRGDGFSISGEHETNIAETDCMSARLITPDGREMKTVWWFASKSGEGTISELSWRWKALIEGKSFYLVNFTSANHDELAFAIHQTNEKLL